MRSGKGANPPVGGLRAGGEKVQKICSKSEFYPYFLNVCPPDSGVPPVGGSATLHRRVFDSYKLAVLAGFRQRQGTGVSTLVFAPTEWMDKIEHSIRQEYPSGTV